MIDETPDIHTAKPAGSKPGEATARPDAVGDGGAVKKKRRSKSSKSSKAAATKAAIAATETRIGYKFSDAALLATAFTHVSALKPATRHRADSYQRLEFLGDHVLGLIVSDMLYRAYPRADEGELSKRLAEARIPHRYEEFDDTHSNVDYRMDVSLPFLYRALKS